MLGKALNTKHKSRLEQMERNTMFLDGKTQRYKSICFP